MWQRLKLRVRMWWWRREIRALAAYRPCPDKPLTATEVALRQHTVALRLLAGYQGPALAPLYGQIKRYIGAFWRTGT